MKTHVKSRSRFARYLSSAAVGLLGCTLLATSAMAQGGSPVLPAGTPWDCVISGAGHKGLAFLVLGDDQSISGYELLVGSPPKQASYDGRNIGGGIGRYFETNGLSQDRTNLLGLSQVGGFWSYDIKGRAIGNLTHVIQVSTNLTTNGLSFVASFVPGKRLTLTASTPQGKMVYRGVPYRTNSWNLSGNWYGTKRMTGQYFNEFFTLTSFADENPLSDEYADLSNFPGIYWTQDGLGPGYDFSGFAMLSSQKKIAFAFDQAAFGDTNSVRHATFGSFSSSRGINKASTLGVEEPSTAVGFNGTMLPASQ